MGIYFLKQTSKYIAGVKFYILLNTVIWVSLVAQWWRICLPSQETQVWPWIMKIPWRRKWNPHHYSCLESSMNKQAWQAIVHGVARVWHDLATKQQPSHKLQYFGHLMQSWLIGKDSDAGKDWGQEEKGTTEDEMAGWHHWLDGHEFVWTPGVGDGQGGLVCCDSWGRKESDTTEWLNWTERIDSNWYWISSPIKTLNYQKKRHGSICLWQKKIR